MRAASRRPEQVAETIRQVLSDAFARDEVRDPRVGPVTITAVRVSNDLSHAEILVMVPGDDAARNRTLEGLASAARFLRARVARVLTTRTVPELRFDLDRGQERAQRIEALLGELRREGGG